MYVGCNRLKLKQLILAHTHTHAWVKELCETTASISALIITAVHFHKKILQRKQSHLLVCLPRSSRAPVGNTIFNFKFCSSIPPLPKLLFGASAGQTIWFQTPFSGGFKKPSESRSSCADTTHMPQCSLSLPLPPFHLFLHLSLFLPFCPILFSILCMTFISAKHLCYIQCCTIKCFYF